MRKYLLTWGIALILVVVMAVTAGDPRLIGYNIGRGIVPTALASLGFLWRRHPVIGYWLVFLLIRVIMAVGAAGAKPA